MNNVPSLLRGRRIHLKELIMRKVIVEVTSRVILDMDEGVLIGDVMDTMNNGFETESEDVSVEDAVILDWAIIDSK